MTIRYMPAGVRLVLLLGVLFSLLTPGARAAPLPSGSLGSYRLTAVATYTLQPEQFLPHSAAGTIGRHLIVVRMIVRDSTHYRVDIHILAPSIDSGVLTVSLEGRYLVAYDSRTGEAASTTITGTPPQPTDIQNGLSFSPMAPIPDPGQSFRAYLAMLHQPGSVLHPTVRVVGHTHLLGHPVAILEYGDLVGTGQSFCPSPSHQTPHPMCHAVSGTGRGRLWVATDHPAILRYTEGHFAAMVSEMMRHQYLYRVTAFRYGAVPLAATRYTPPVPLHKAPRLEMAVLGGGDGGWFSGWPAPWRTGGLYQAPPPIDSHGYRYVENGVSIRSDSLAPGPTAIGILYYHPSAPGFGSGPPAQYTGSGPYVYVQERIQIHGVPAALRRGRHIQRGRCSLWTGWYRKGLPWLAIARQRDVLFVTSNALTQRDLVNYGFKSLCG